jgi:hypothetical protein
MQRAMPKHDESVWRPGAGFLFGQDEVGPELCSLRIVDPPAGLPFLGYVASDDPVGASGQGNSDIHQIVRRSNLPREFGHPSNYRSEQFARTSAFEAALRSGNELIGTIVACA